MTAKEFYENDENHLFSDQKENDYKSAIIGLMQDYHDSEVKKLNLPAVSNSLLEKGKMLVEANTYADECVRRTLFGKDRELAKERIKVMYLLDEINKSFKQ